jgi:hypothetical protein
MTLACEIIGWAAIIGNFFTLRDTGPGLGGAGAVLLALAYAGAFNGL